MLNLFTGWDTEAIDHGIVITYFLDFVREIISQRDAVVSDYILSWFANIVQHPGIQNRTAILLLGEEGTGKSTLAKYFTTLLGTRYTDPNLTRLSRLTGRFSHKNVSGKVLAVLNEVGKDFTQADLTMLKSLITEDLTNTEKNLQKQQPLRTASTYR